MEKSGRNTSRSSDRCIHCLHVHSELSLFDQLKCKSEIRQAIEMKIRIQQLDAKTMSDTHCSSLKSYCESTEMEMLQSPVPIYKTPVMRYDAVSVSSPSSSPFSSLRLVSQTIQPSNWNHCLVVPQSICFTTVGEGIMGSRPYLAKAIFHRILVKSRYYAIANVPIFKQSTNVENSPTGVSPLPVKFSSVFV